MAKELTLKDLDQTLREHHAWVWPKLEEIDKRLKRMEIHLAELVERTKRK